MGHRKLRGGIRILRVGALRDIGPDEKFDDEPLEPDRAEVSQGSALLEQKNFRSKS
jgi:hypothetical protein